MGVTNFRAANCYASANGVGPVGSTTMTIVCVYTNLHYIHTEPLAAGASEGIFSRNNAGATTGWMFRQVDNSALAQFYVLNGAAAGCTVTAVTYSPATMLVGVPCIAVLSLSANLLTARSNFSTVDATAACVGYTPPGAGDPTRIGLWTSSSACVNCPIMDCAMFDTYAGTGFTSATYGNGLAGLIALWSEDLQQGRYLTKPQGGALGANDWYWSARDIVGANGSTGPVWTDRGPNATPMARAGAVQGASIMPRF